MSLGIKIFSVREKKHKYKIVKQNKTLKCNLNKSISVNAGFLFLFQDNVGPSFVSIKALMNIISRTVVSKYHS